MARAHPAAGGVPTWRRRLGRPIAYPYLRGPRPLADYRTVFARRDGHGFASAEMPSAARPFTPAVLCGLHERGVDVATLTLHTGVASLEAGEEPLPERYAVPDTTAAAVNATRAAGGRIVAVGTTVTRALETVADPDGDVRVGAGWTDLVLGPDRPARVVDGLVTGWHEPEASHLLLLRGGGGPELVARGLRRRAGPRVPVARVRRLCPLLPGDQPPGAQGDRSSSGRAAARRG